MKIKKMNLFKHLRTHIIWKKLMNKTIFIVAIVLITKVIVRMLLSRALGTGKM